MHANSTTHARTIADHTPLRHCGASRNPPPLHQVERGPGVRPARHRGRRPDSPSLAGKGPGVRSKPPLNEKPTLVRDHSGAKTW